MELCLSCPPDISSVQHHMELCLEYPRAVGGCALQVTQLVACSLLVRQPHDIQHLLLGENVFFYTFYILRILVLLEAFEVMLRHLTVHARSDICHLSFATSKLQPATAPLLAQEAGMVCAPSMLSCCTAAAAQHARTPLFTSSGIEFSLGPRSKRATHVHTRSHTLPMQVRIYLH